MKDFWNINSNDNTLFVTAQCNNRCVMCCQPPIKRDDIDELYNRNIELIHTAPKGIKVVGISGGEPTLLGDKLFGLTSEIAKYLPEADIHILSNGRKFSDINYARHLKESTSCPVLAGIPIHSDYYKDHDEITSVKGSFEETVYGLYNLNAVGIDIELRVLINAQNYFRLPQISDFIFKNLPFVKFVAFMGMEYTGWAIKNKDSLFISPEHYQEELKDAVLNLDGFGIDVSFYNIPLCLLDEGIRGFACRSISDWKTSYSEVCTDCSRKSECCGLFATSKIPYNEIKAI